MERTAPWKKAAAIFSSVTLVTAFVAYRSGVIRTPVSAAVPTAQQQQVDLPIANVSVPRLNSIGLFDGTDAEQVRVGQDGIVLIGNNPTSQNQPSAETLEKQNVVMSGSKMTVVAWSPPVVGSSPEGSSDNPQSRGDRSAQFDFNILRRAVDAGVSSDSTNATRGNSDINNVSFEQQFFSSASHDGNMEWFDQALLMSRGLEAGPIAQPFADMFRPASFNTPLGYSAPRLSTLQGMQSNVGSAPVSGYSHVQPSDAVMHGSKSLVISPSVGRAIKDGH